MNEFRGGRELPFKFSNPWLCNVAPALPQPFLIERYQFNGGNNGPRSIGTKDCRPECQPPDFRLFEPWYKKCSRS